MSGWMALRAVLALTLGVSLSSTKALRCQSWHMVPELVRRYRHAMALDETSGRILLFGGGLSFGDYLKDDTWEWDGTTWNLLSAE